VETVPPNAKGLVPPWNWYGPRDTGHVAVKGRIEAGHLSNTRERSPKCLDERNLPGEVVRVERTDPSQFVEHPWRNALRLDEAAPPMNDTVSDGGHRRKTAGVLNPLDHQVRCICLVRSLYLALLQATAVGRDHNQSSVSLPNPLDASGEDPQG
jgi:hypothetical protein